MPEDPEEPEDPEDPEEDEPDLGIHPLIVFQLKTLNGSSSPVEYTAVIPCLLCVDAGVVHKALVNSFNMDF